MPFHQVAQFWEAAVLGRAPDNGDVVRRSGKCSPELTAFPHQLSARSQAIRVCARPTAPLHNAKDHIISCAHGYKINSPLAYLHSCA